MFDFWKKNKKSVDYSELFEVKDFLTSPYLNVLIKTTLNEVRLHTNKSESILDAGCGEGYLTRKIKKIRSNVSGFDISSKLVRIAQNKNPAIKYWVEDLESQRLNKTQKKFSLVISNLVLIDLKNINPAIKKMHDYMKPDGHMIVSIPHPCFYQKKSHEWFDGETQRNPIFENYFHEGVFQKKIGNIIETYHFHRTLETYFEIFRKNKLIVISLKEPRPSKSNNGLLQKATKLPFFIVFILKKIPIVIN